MSDQHVSDGRSNGVAPEQHERVRGVLSGVRLVGVLTLGSRVLGLVRDVGMATLFGNGAVLDAFTVAFRIPNLARRLFGEGALSTALIPALTQEMERRGKPAAWQLASCVVTLVGTFLLLVTILLELGLHWLARTPLGPEARLLLDLTAILLPYLVVICLAAQFGAVLHTLGHFTWPALLPILLNVGWIAALWLLLPQLSGAQTKIRTLSATIVVLGGLQLAVLFIPLRRYGFRFGFRWERTGGRALQVLVGMVPIVFGLSVTQLNSLCDSLIAWGFAAPEATVGGVGRGWWPLESGTASALYFGQRLYQFPVGVFGVALGTVLFPLLSRHAARGDRQLLREDLELGLRLVLAIGLPASAGLVLLAAPITSLLFRYGAFDLQDAEQTSRMIAAYGCGVWAYCGLLIAHRGLYALGDRLTPTRIGVRIVLLNVVLNLWLIWPLGGPALALTTAGCSALQLGLVLWCLSERLDGLDWRGLGRTAWRTAAATVTMSLVCWTTLRAVPEGDAVVVRLVRVLVPAAASVGVYFVAAAVLGVDDLWRLLPGRK